MTAVATGTRPDDQQSTEPEAALPDGFRWWPELVVRGAGFAASGVLDLADPDLGAMAAAVLAAEENPEAWQRFRAAFADATTRMGVRLREIAASPRFQHAVAWQNHTLLPLAVEPFLRRPATEPRNSKNRQREELVASYWQRYCMKNDSIGFFGPVGWAGWDDRPHSDVVVGDALVRRSTVYFETWAVDQLVAAIEAEPGLRRWLAPRRMPYLGLDGDDLVLPTGGRVALTPAQARLLRACDGVARACDLGGPETEAVLADFARRRWTTWRIELPGDPFPERSLRAVLARVDDEGLRARCLRPLELMERCKAAVAEATDAASLSAALAAADETFHELTGAASKRNGGQAYGGRTLMYQDCARDLDAVFGQDLMAAALPVELLARGARWLCRQAADAARVALLEVHRRIAQDGSCALSAMWAAALGPLTKQVGAAVAEARTEYVRRWTSVFAVPDGARAVRRTYAELLPLVRSAFAVDGPGWNGARYLSPDLMVSAPDLDAVRRGEFQVVVGELHLAMNSQRSNCFVRQHPEPETLLRHVDEDFPAPRLLPAPPRSGPVRRSVRTQSALTRDRDVLVEFHHHTVAADRPGLVPSADIVVSEQDGELVAVLPDGPRFDVLDVFSEVLMDLVLNAHSLFAGRAHAPRVVIDRCVVHRETWRIDPATAAFVKEKDEARRFVAARAWRVAAGLPSRVFAKAGATDKPVYIDFDSPVLVNVLAKMLRGAEPGHAVGFTELLPDLDHLWLVDQAGDRYTSELRFAMVDRLGGPDGEDAP
ncbi:lantibiotic dehydratase [Labedaea rhizosphaerae]|uniref:Lantibiotic biosynthesis dehydratase-like protein n=1 Tax=Labedaea rhizosphaerae TaxID=598644 RepID=A0A4R6RU64_LABRH|nr:lantibiotic dehydratase [Labedaea rhizosphaerae]TDP89887.1 lantibiotic biosynthesis dehydratase-like protein [Labedaea rhizosphaerae]